MNLVLTLYFALILPSVDHPRVVAFNVPTDPARHITWENCKEIGEKTAAGLLKDHPMLAKHLQLRNVRCSLPDDPQPKTDI